MGSVITLHYYPFSRTNQPDHYHGNLVNTGCLGFLIINYSECYHIRLAYYCIQLFRCESGLLAFFSRNAVRR